jgi:hypothetical protein
VFFEEWGMPHISDLNKDGKDELLVEFPGMHLELANVVLVSYTEEKRLETATVVTDKLSKGRHMYANFDRDSNAMRINIGFVDETDSSTHGHHYEDKELIKLR